MKSVVVESPFIELAARFARILGREPAAVARRLRGAVASRGQSPGLRLGRGIELLGASRITLGPNVTLYGNTVIDATGKSGAVTIGGETHVDRFCGLFGQGGLAIGEGCAIAAGVLIYTVSNQYRHSPLDRIIDQPRLVASVTIGNDVWIGARATILPGVSIGDHAVVGAGAVVASAIPPWSIAVGMPARVIRDRREGGAAGSKQSQKAG